MPKGCVREGRARAAVQSPMELVDAESGGGLEVARGTVLAAGCSHRRRWWQRRAQPVSPRRNEAVCAGRELLCAALRQGVTSAACSSRCSCTS